MTYFVYDDASGTLQYEVEGSTGAYTIRNAYGIGAAGPRPAVPADGREPGDEFRVRPERQHDQPLDQ